LKTRFETDLPRDEILELLKSCAEATFFHSPAWLEILSEAFPRFEHGWLAAREGRTLLGLMPVVKVRRGPVYMVYALPFGTYGDPVAADGDAERALFDAFFGMASPALCAGAGGNLILSERIDCLPRGWKSRVEECRMIELPGSFEEYRSAGMSRKRRQLCNKCEREGMKARRLEGDADLDLFYDTYLHGATGWGGVHPYPREFFSSLMDRYRDGVCFWGAFMGDSLLAAHVDFYFGETAQAWQAGVTPEASEYDAAAYLVMVAVREAIERGIRSFNLGSSSGDGGMIFFKESMGGREHLYLVLEKQRRWLGWLRRR
jgi:hypothetical protein